MQQTHDTRIADLIGDLTELSTVLGDLHFRWAVTEETLALCEEFEHDLRFERLTNNLRDGWRLSEAAGLHGCVSSPATAEEVLAAAPFARLLTEADNLHGLTWDFDEPGTDEGVQADDAPGVAEFSTALASTVAALADLIAGLIAGRVTLPPLLDGDELAAADAEAEALVNRTGAERIADLVTSGAMPPELAATVAELAADVAAGLIAPGDA